MKIRIFNTQNLTVSAPLDVTRAGLKVIENFCYDSDYKWNMEDDSIMSQEELDEFIRDAHEFEINS